MKKEKKEKIMKLVNKHIKATKDRSTITLSAFKELQNLFLFTEVDNKFVLNSWTYSKPTFLKKLKMVWVLLKPEFMALIIRKKK